MAKFLFTLIAVLLFSTLHAQQVTTKATQAGDNVLITYDMVSGKVGQTFDIKVECSTDGGKTFTIFPTTLTGDLKGVTAGIGKRIVWEALKEREVLAGENFVFQLVATVKNQKETFSENSGTFTDTRDGHVYKWIKIGTQIWMAENLAYLPSVSPPNNGSETSKMYYVYNYNGTSVKSAKSTENYKIYGGLYNWTAANEVCPKGWHLPNNAEWDVLDHFLGGYDIAGGKFKEIGTMYWESPNIGATNEFSFTALPGGNRYSNGRFYGIGKFGIWWSSTENNTRSAVNRTLYYSSSTLGTLSNWKECGFSVRCVKDN